MSGRIRVSLLFERVTHSGEVTATASFGAFVDKPDTDTLARVVNYTVMNEFPKFLEGKN